MLILDMSCIARVPASVSSAPITLGLRRTLDGTLGESALKPKVSVERAVSPINKIAAARARSLENPRAISTKIS
jgi:hypothetical protein